MYHMQNMCVSLMSCSSTFDMFTINNICKFNGMYFCFVFLFSLMILFYFFIYCCCYFWLLAVVSWQHLLLFCLAAHWLYIFLKNAWKFIICPICHANYKCCLGPNISISLELSLVWFQYANIYDETPFFWSILCTCMFSIPLL